MSKTILIDEVVNITGVTKVKAAETVDAIFAKITEELKNGGSISISGFGSFVVKKRDARVGRNPKTGETINIAAKTVPAFKASKSLKDAVNK